MKKKITAKPVESDLERLKNVSRKILGQLERAMDHEVGSCDEDDALRQRAHDRMFGIRTSLASTLVTLAELMMKLGLTGEGGDAAPEMPANMLSAGDMALVEAFVQKMKTS